MFNQFISGDTATQTAGRIPEESTNSEKYNYYLKKALSIKRLSLPAELNEDYEKISSHNTYLKEELLELETETNSEELSEPEILEVPPKEIKKHDLNIYPAIDGQDYLELKEDIRQNGYDPKYPIWLYQGGILDGWNRIQICAELNIKPVYQTFIGNDSDALAFVLRSNHRRNLTSDQRACLATDYNSIFEKIKKEAKERQIEGGKNKVRQNFAQPNRDDNKTDSKVAKMFGTNRTYVQKARKIKKENPEVFEKVKKGEETFSSINKRRNHASDNGFNTPIDYEEKVKAVFFNPDLEPTTPDGSQGTYQATTHYRIITDELDKNWNGNVFVNPPNSTTKVAAFINKFIEEYNSGNLTQGIILTTNSTQADWFHKIMKIVPLACFTDGSVKFHNKGKKVSSKHGHVFFYIGSNDQKFIEEFAKLGLVMRKA